MTISVPESLYDRLSRAAGGHNDLAPFIRKILALRMAAEFSTEKYTAPPV